MSDVPLTLPTEYRTLNDQTFLIYDNQSLTERVMVFAFETGLQLLGDAESWFMDVTHYTVPKQFSQSFVIRVPLGQSYIPVMYAFLPSKLQATYEECLTGILDACLQKNLRPSQTTVVENYETGIHNAVRSTVDQNIHIHGCFYHLTFRIHLGRSSLPETNRNI